MRKSSWNQDGFDSLLELPDSENNATVDVRIIGPPCYRSANSDPSYDARLNGLEKRTIPSYSFLVSHCKSPGWTGLKQQLLFDVGVRKDWRAVLSSDNINLLTECTLSHVDRDIVDILNADEGKLGITAKHITHMVWSKNHLDHRGDIKRFPHKTQLILGPGSTASYKYACTTGPEGANIQRELEERIVCEMRQDDFDRKIGGFLAHDVFGDGSFYLLSRPGETKGHLCGLARVTPSTRDQQATWIFMGGDCCPYKDISRSSSCSSSLSSSLADSDTSCGSEHDQTTRPTGNIQPCEDFDKFLVQSKLAASEDQAIAEQHISLIQQFDADENVMVCGSHDATFLGQIDMYPKRVNEWQANGWKEKVYWKFVEDFAASVSDPI